MGEEGWWFVPEDDVIPLIKLIRLSHSFAGPSSKSLDLTDREILGPRPNRNLLVLFPFLAGFI